MAFAFQHSAAFGAALGEGLFGDLTEDVVEAVLAEAGKFATDIIAPLNAVGDRHGTPFKDGAVTMPPGWRGAYRARSYPNLIPLSAKQVTGITAALEAFQFDTIYGHYFDRVITNGGKRILQISAKRYVDAISGAYEHE